MPQPVDPLAWLNRVARAARDRGVVCRPLTPADRPACATVARESFVEGLADLLHGTAGFVLEAHGTVVGYVLIDEAPRVDPATGVAVSGELTDAAVLQRHRHWAGLLLLAAAGYIVERGGVWLADCLRETSYRFLKGADARGFVAVVGEAEAAYRGFPMRRLLFTVPRSAARPADRIDRSPARRTCGPGA